MPQTTKTVQQVLTVTTYTCDWCGAYIGYDFFHPTPCHICRRYGCDEHLHPTVSSDYPERHCRECWRIGEPFRARIAELEAAIEAEAAAWHKQAKAAAEENG